MQAEKTVVVLPFVLKSLLVFTSLLALIAALAYVIVPNRSALTDFTIPPAAFALLIIPALIIFIFLSLKFNQWVSKLISPDTSARLFDSDPRGLEGLSGKAQPVK